MGTPRIPGPARQSEFMLTLTHAQVTADTPEKLFKVPAGRTLRIDAIDYVNPTGLAASATDYFAVQLKQGSVVVGEWSTLNVGAEGALTANTFVALDMSDTDADLIIEAGEELSLNLDETGTATLPAGRMIIRGRYV